MDHHRVFADGDEYTNYESCGTLHHAVSSPADQAAVSAATTTFHGTAITAHANLRSNEASVLQIYIDDTVDDWEDILNASAHASKAALRRETQFISKATRLIKTRSPIVQ